MADSENDMDATTALLARFQQERHSLRLSASNIAAIAGYHPWKDIHGLLMDLIYQGGRGQMLLERDCDNLSIEMVSEEKALLSLAARAGVSIQDALDVKRGKRSVKSIQEANDIKESVLKKSKLTNPTEIKELKEGVRNAIDTSYGTHNEDQALNEYEKITGWPVTDRNAEIMIWDFDDKGRPGKVHPLRKREDVPDPICAVCEDAAAEISDPSKANEKQEEDDTQPCASEQLEDASKPVKRNRPYFCILGSIDGIREELVSREPTADDDDSFCTRKVIVECKHRMATLQKCPPLYDQIQAVVYMLMYDMDQADIVQVLRTKNAKGKEAASDEDAANDKAREEFKVDSTSITITTHRIKLDDAAHGHRFHWENTILPRVNQFVGAVYNFRKDDHQRYRLLVAVAQKSAREAWKIVFEACPWLEKCDTAFCRINEHQTK